MVMGSLRQETEVAVIGGGPGGYVAALRAADLGKEVLLVEERDRRGGACLLEGCIPSKTLIHAVEIAQAAREAKSLGLTFRDMALDREALRQWKESVVEGLSKGIDGLLKRRNVMVVKGRARFESNKGLAVEGDEVSASDVAGVDFKQCIIATGSRVVQLPMTRDLPVWTSREALALAKVPERLLVVGGGYIGLELGLVYAGLGSRVTVMEMMPQLLPGVDDDLVAVVAKSCEKRFEAIHLGSKVVAVEKTSAGFAVKFEADGKPQSLETGQVLVSIGRRPNTDDLGLEHTRVQVNAQGIIEVDAQRRTAESNVFAIGDVTAGPMLAHKASREAHVAAEVIAGRPAAFDNRAIPAVVYTDPEIAVTGLSEIEARAREIPFSVARFPLSALGRTRTLGRSEGMVKILYAPEGGRVLGVGIAGPHASELIAEPTLAIEMGATLEDLVVTIHPHPTMSEGLMEAAELASGAPIHINPAAARGKKRAGA
jgi:dihydrolipoamide dehydrogenase